MSALRGSHRSVKLLVAANWIAAIVSLAILGKMLIQSWNASNPDTDIDSQGYALLSAFVCLPAAALFGLAGAAHWWQLPLRWLLQALAIALPLGILVVFLS